MTTTTEGNNTIVYPFDDDHARRITVLPSGDIVMNFRTGEQLRPDRARQFADGMHEAARIAENIPAALPTTPPDGPNQEAA